MTEQNKIITAAMCHNNQMAKQTPWVHSLNEGEWSQKSATDVPTGVSVDFEVY